MFSIVSEPHCTLCFQCNHWVKYLHLNKSVSYNDYIIPIFLVWLKNQLSSLFDGKSPFRYSWTWHLEYHKEADRLHVDSSPPGQNGCHFPEDIFKCIFMNEKFCIVIQISLKFVPKGPINNIPALVQKMAWRGSCDKPLSEPMLTHFTDAYMRH